MGYLILQLLTLCQLLFHSADLLNVADILDLHPFCLAQTRLKKPHLHPVLVVHHQQSFVFFVKSAELVFILLSFLPASLLPLLKLTLQLKLLGFERLDFCLERLHCCHICFLAIRFAVFGGLPGLQVEILFF